MEAVRERLDGVTGQPGGERDDRDGDEPSDPRDRVVDAGCDARACVVDRPECRCCHRGDDEAHAEGPHEDGRQHAADVGGARLDPEEQQEAERGDDRPDRQW